LFSAVPARAAVDTCSSRVACFDSKLKDKPTAFEVCNV
jgi:hypothetical protein